MESSYEQDDLQFYSQFAACSFHLVWVNLPNVILQQLIFWHCPPTYDIVVMFDFFFLITYSYICCQKVFVMMFMVWYFQFWTLAVVFLSNSVIYPEHSCVPSAFNLPPTEIGNTFLWIDKKSRQKLYLSLQKTACAKWWKRKSTENRNIFPFLFHRKCVTQMCFPCDFSLRFHLDERNC